jgi:hypothetical protein
VRRITKAALLLVTATMMTAGGYLAAACGSSDSSATVGDDGGSEATSNPPPPPPPPPGDDGGSDGGCGAENSACLVNGTDDGLCKSSSCAPCADPADDSACKAAYGAGFDGGAAICDKGTCVPGDCRQNSDCTGGKICGLATPNTCGACASDAQCKTSYGDGFYCNTTTGGCVANTCANGDGGTCTGAPADICCTGGGGPICSTGNCCNDTQCVLPKLCVKATGATAGVCSGCPAVVDGNYFVDPSVADDSAATGGPTCPFNSITHALAFLGAAQAAPVNVIVVTATTTFGAKETFPLIVPVNVTVKSQTAATPATLQVATGAKGFVLGSATSAVKDLVVDGQTKATLGIEALTGSSMTTTVVSGVTVKNFVTDGILVHNTVGKATGGGLAIGPGVSSTGNTRSGLHVQDNGVAVVTATDGAKTHFDANTFAGAFVEGVGQITMTGAVGATPPTTGTLTTNGNGAAGLSISQTPGAAAPPTNTVTGLTAWNTKAGDGIIVLGGSSLTLRSSSVLANQGNGVHVKYFVGAGGTHINTTLYMDLGNAVNGLNTLQALAGSNPNTGAGACLEIDQNSGGLLKAEGNKWVTQAGPGGNPPAAAVDCSVAAMPPKQLSLNKGNGACSAGVAVGIVANASTPNDVDVTTCTK